MSWLPTSIGIFIIVILTGWMLIGWDDLKKISEEWLDSHIKHGRNDFTKTKNLFSLFILAILGFPPVQFTILFLIAIMLIIGFSPELCIITLVIIIMLIF